jgi:glyoxylase-like metal-dependent hydrolase (beta-lactamase superfamily II)
MIFHQFFSDDQDSSYLLADPVTRYAAVLDPEVQAERGYLEVIRRLDLRLMYVIETHAHESHLSAAPALRAETGARLIAHSSADLACVDMDVDDGDSIFVGEEYLRVMATPGHSPCSLSYLWRDRVFTGHTLLAGAAGPCQRADADAGRLFDSIRRRLFALPDETLVCPGRATGQRPVSSIGRERAANTDLQPDTTRERFINRKRAQARPGGGWREDSLAANRRCQLMNRTETI